MSLLSLFVVLLALATNARATRFIRDHDRALAAGSKFYSAEPSELFHRHPVLTNTIKTVFDFHQFNDFQVHRLRFPFPFFGNTRRHVVFTLHGFLTPHLVNCSSRVDSLCLPETLFRISHISPLSGQWHKDLDSNTSVTLFEDRDNQFAHFEWRETHTDLSVCNVTQHRGSNYSASFVDQSRASHEHCLDSLDATFSATLYRNGDIVFDYEKLGNRSGYGNFGATHRFDGGRIGLSDSSLADFAFNTYAELNFSHIFTHTSRPRSIRFKALIPTGRCTFLTTRAQCDNTQSDSHEEGCTWCEDPPSMWANTPRFCTNAHNDRSSYFAELVRCHGHQGGLTSAQRVGLGVGLSFGLLFIGAVVVAFVFGDRLKQPFGFKRFGGAESSAAGRSATTLGVAPSVSAGTAGAGKKFDNVELC